MRCKSDKRAVIDNIYCPKECVSVCYATVGGAIGVECVVQAGIGPSSVWPAGYANPSKCRTLTLTAASVWPGQVMVATSSAMGTYAVLLRVSRCSAGSWMAVAPM